MSAGGALAALALQISLLPAASEYCHMPKYWFQDAAQKPIVWSTFAEAEAGCSALPDCEGFYPSFDNLNRIYVVGGCAYWKCFGYTGLAGWEAWVKPGWHGCASATTTMATATTMTTTETMTATTTTTTAPAGYCQMPTYAFSGVNVPMSWEGLAEAAAGCSALPACEGFYAGLDAIYVVGGAAYSKWLEGPLEARWTAWIKAGLHGCGTSTSTKTSTKTSTGTATMTTRTTTTSTSTSTEFGDREATCGLSHMRCPVPPHASGTYYILGSRGSSACSLQSAAGQHYFEFHLGDCNVSRTTDEVFKVVRDVVTIVYEPPSHGTLITKDLGGPSVTTVFCMCESPLTALLSSGFQSETQAPPSSALVGGDGKFVVTSTIHRTDSFDDPMGAGDVVEAATKRLYLEVESASTTDVIGLESCAAAPSSDTNDPSLVQYLAPGCPAGPLGLQTHAAKESQAVRISVVNFKFAGTTDVYMWCHVVRCTTEPCGQCGAPRRLLDGRRFSEDEAEGGGGEGEGTSTLTQTQTWFQVQFSPDVIVLPGPKKLRQDASPVWKQPAAAAAHGGSSSTSSLAWTNITLFGSPASLSQTFLSSLAHTLAQHSSGFFSSPVRVLRILAVEVAREGHGRALSDAAVNTTATATATARVEALIAECVVEVETQTAAEVPAESEIFKTSLGQALHELGGWHSPPFVALGQLVLLGEASTTAPADFLAQPDLLSPLLLLAIVATGLACGGTLCVLVVLRKYRRRGGGQGGASELKKFEGPSNAETEGGEQASDLCI